MEEADEVQIGQSSASTNRRTAIFLSSLADTRGRPTGEPTTSDPCSERVMARQIKARLPLMFKGQPRKARYPKDILVSKDVYWTIPEYSITDTEVAFHHMSGYAIGRVGGIARSDRELVLRQFDGALYRKVAERDADLDFVFSLAFPTDIESGFERCDRRISLRESEGSLPKGDPSPCSIDLLSQIEWRQSCSRSSERVHDETWPYHVKVPDGFRYRGLLGGHNFAVFEDIVPSLASFDGEGYEDCVAMYPLHLRRFALFDGELWMQTAPPVIRLHRLHLERATSVVMTISLAPSSPNTRLDKPLFSIGAMSDAQEFAHRMLDAEIVGPTKSRPGEVLDLTGSYEIPMPEALSSHDHELEELRSFSYGLAVETRRFARRNPEWAEKKGITAQDMADVERSFEEVMATNYVTGEFGDATDWIDTNFALWRKLTRKATTYTFGQAPLSDLLLDRARNYAVNRPISIGIPAFRPHDTDLGR